jgi:tRNA1(Val) A37 N6-methylase TrmN6
MLSGLFTIYERISSASFQILLEQSRLKESLRRHEEEGNKIKVEQTREKLASLNLNKESLSRQIEIVEMDVKKKQRDLAAAK